MDVETREMYFPPSQSQRLQNVFGLITILFIIIWSNHFRAFLRMTSCKLAEKISLILPFNFISLSIKIHLYACQVTISLDLQHPSATFQCSFAQRGRAFVNNGECGPAGVTSAPTCHWESRASGSRPTEWHRRGRPNACVVCRTLAGRVLTRWTELCFTVCQEFLRGDVWRPSRFANTQRVTSGAATSVWLDAVRDVSSCRSSGWRAWITVPVLCTVHALVTALASDWDSSILNYQQPWTLLDPVMAVGSLSPNRPAAVDWALAFCPSGSTQDPPQKSKAILVNKV